MSLQWKIKAFDTIRSWVIWFIAFKEWDLVVEQNCVYLDLDGKDLLAPNRRVWRWNSGTCPPFKPGISFDNASIGRVVVDANIAKKVGTWFNAEAIAGIASQYNETAITIGAQCIWRSFTKVTVSYKQEMYLEDDIPHIEMIKE
jgi:ElaA protein